MNLYLRDAALLYESENIARLFAAQLTVCLSPLRRNRQNCIYLRYAARGDGYRMVCFAASAEKKLLKSEIVSCISDVKRLEESVCRFLFDTLCETFDKHPVWGILTGIRPASFARRLLRHMPNPADVKQLLCTRFRVTPEKADLALETTAASDAVLAQSSEKSFSLYISIPYCPSRCRYCSFVSKTIEREKDSIQDYLRRLCVDVERISDTAASLDLQLGSIYIGGGTPSVLTAPEMEKLLGVITARFPRVPEFTFEAGRPDTITREKLEVMRAFGVGRISINPQTANDAILAALGRRHTAQDTEEAFALARDAGFSHINADLIAGLPGDTTEGFRQSLLWLLHLAAENITVHALTSKRASDLRENAMEFSSGASDMVEGARHILREWGYYPYYLYRQKGTVENLENTGYTKPGSVCRYNIFMMDEIHTVLACGAGAVTKLVDKKKERILRIHNLKYPAEYLADSERIERICRGIIDFYQ